MRKKKAHQHHIKTFLLFCSILVLALFFVFSTVGRKEFTFPHKFALDMVGTIQYAAKKTTGYFNGIWTNYVALWDVREENISLKEELEKLRARNNEYREAAVNNIRLQKLLQLKETLPAPTITAEIIGKDPSLWFKTVTINRGSSDGVKKGMPVVTAKGVAGQVINTSPHYSKVLLAIDPNSAIDVVIQKTRVQGIIKGNGSKYLMHYVLKNSTVEEHDRIVTSGIGGVFPKGLYVGEVTRAVKNRRGMFQDIEINPAVDFSRLEYLIIIMRETSLAE